MPTDPTVTNARLQRKLDKRNARIAGLERRVKTLEAALALRCGDVVAVDAYKLRQDMARAVADALCNIRMIPVHGALGEGKKILDVRVSKE